MAELLTVLVCGIGETRDPVLHCKDGPGGESRTSLETFWIKYHLNILNTASCFVKFVTGGVITNATVLNGLVLGATVGCHLSFLSNWLGVSSPGNNLDLPGRVQ